MKVLCSGAAGFVCQELAVALIRDDAVSRLILTDLVKPCLPSQLAPGDHTRKATCIAADLTQEETRKELFSQPLDVVYLLHGIMSGAAEANLELGLAVNLDATIGILNILRTSNPAVKVIYTSVLAAYGPSPPEEVISETTAPNPQSSYGTQKVMVEGLINDFSRRGLMDGRILRLPTIFPRAGPPTGAASSFLSDIVREPLNGRSAVLPVKNKNLKNFACSSTTIVKNLLHARDVPKERYEPFGNRVVIMPGHAISVQGILDAIVAVSPIGKEVLKLVEEKYDRETERIVASWPSNFDISRARQLGFAPDEGLQVAVSDYYRRYVQTKQQETENGR